MFLGCVVYRLSLSKMNCWDFWSVLLCLCVAFSVPITQTVFASYYSDNNQCSSSSSSDASFYMPLNVWLLVQGIWGVCAVPTLTLPMRRQLFLLPFQVLFVIAWTIVGAISFWSYTPVCEPAPFRNMILASLILDIIGLGPLLCCGLCILAVMDVNGYGKLTGGTMTPEGLRGFL